MFAKLLIAVAFLVMVMAQDKSYDDDSYYKTPQYHSSRSYEHSWVMASACTTHGVHAFMVLIPAIIAWIMTK